MSLRKTAISGMMWTFAQQFATQGIGFIVSIILARLLSPEEFGLVGMITVFAGIGGILMNSGLTQSLIRSSNPDQEDYSTVFFYNLIMSIVLYAIIFFLSPFISRFFNQPILTSVVRVYCLSFIINAFGAVQLARLTKVMNFKSQMIIAIPSLIASGILGILLAKTGFGVWSLVWMTVFQSFLNCLQLWIKTKWRPSFVFNISKFKFHFLFGSKMAFSGLLDTIFTNIYQIIIGKFFVAAQVGYFNRADSLKQLPVRNISIALNKVTYPLFASIQNDDIRLKMVYKQIMQMVIFIIAPLLVIMAVLADPLFEFIFGSKWLPAVPYFQILCIAGILYPIHSYNLNILGVKGRSDLFLRLEIFKKILVVITILIAIRFSIIGLLWSQVVLSVMAFFINTHFSGKLIKYSGIEQAKDLLPLLMISSFMGAILWGIDFLMMTLDLNNFSRIIIGGSFGVLTFIGIAYLLKIESFNYFKKIILKK